MSLRQQQNGKLITEYRTPDKRDTDLVFAVHQGSPNLDFLYDDFSKSFGRTLDRSGKGDREDVKVHFHTQNYFN
jgi:hypothetical protein